MHLKPLTLGYLALFCALAAVAAPEDTASSKTPVADAAPMQDESAISHNSVRIGGQNIGYTAIAGTLVVYTSDPADTPPDAKPEEQPAAAAMSYVAYFKGEGDGNNGKPIGDPTRPLVFLYNGGPGSSTIWLHMGAFGPRRVVTADDSHTPPAPYRVVDNDQSLLDVADLVFIDAPGTGFGHLRGKDREKAFWGIDADAKAFASFIQTFLSRYQRWNAPKYLFGESYGTTRSAVLANVLQSERSIDLNGVILLSQILSFDTSIDGPAFNPGIDQAYALALPTYAATAWYHHQLPSPPASLDALLPQVEQFALGDYWQALAQGNALPAERKQAIAERLHQFTGLPVAYLLKGNLRIDGGTFEQQLQNSEGLATGRLDSRFSGPTLDPLAKSSDYDPQSSAISSAYVAAYNDYVRRSLKFGDGKTFKVFADVFKSWNMQHQPPGAPMPVTWSGPNVMPDLANAMKINPNLKVQMLGGYYDLATPYFAAEYELRHLPIAAAQQGNIEMHFYPSGHMIYAHQESLKTLHQDVAGFIQRTH